MNKRHMRLAPKIVIGTFVVFLLFLFVLGVREVFFKKNYYPIEFEKEVESASKIFGVDESVIYSVIYCESSFKKSAESNMGAVGLMQLLPETLEWLCGKEGVEYNSDFLLNPEKNIYYGTMFLSILYDKYENWDLVHAAYHAGHTRVDNWIEEGTVVIDADGNLTGIPIKATDVYVEKINTAKKAYIKLLDKEEK